MPKKLYKLIPDRRIEIYYCDELLNEFSKVIQRPKFKKYITQKQVQKFIKLVTTKLKCAPFIKKATKSRDSKDGYFLSLAFSVNADYLITGDNDLLLIKIIEKTQIVNFNDFIRLIY